MYRLILLTLCLSACSRLAEVGKSPDFSPLEGSYQHHAMYSTPLPHDIPPATPADASSLWSANRESLFGERRAARRGDILTVVIEIDDKAEMSNTSGRSRAGNDSMGIPSLFGIPERLNEKLPEGASMADAVETRSSSAYQGQGSVSRKEKLTLRVAATVVEELANGVLRIEGQQEVRVNYELRELIVTGYVRPADISRQNEITYDKIAGARISYGGRGQITDVQQPRYGQQIADVLLPF
ncbi:MAG: flagellar basal body L-ring protein [Rhodobacterales bacterium 65-51]|jgi:flagellar L-ring protein precursor FlgH|uniref:flagellar basal body L-ring protein FlgH n=1 Tax=uncultured Gemmobacter sp. TaxID=1095917 RepID=UPI000964BB2F|nr:flagellar basal body L-ring protein FlgH [uncultured Gemmobacter sp.]OJY33041.1 MAG: flagellar basal body L-ring protein [Rhodobacterales bacterium 65-51]